MAVHQYVSVDDPAIDLAEMARVENSAAPEGNDDEVKAEMDRRANARMVRYAETLDANLLRFKQGVRPTVFTLDTPSPRYFFTVLRKLQALDPTGNETLVRTIQAQLKSVRLPDGQELTPAGTELDSCDTRIATTKWFDTVVERLGARLVIEVATIASRLCALPADKRPPSFSPGF